MYLERLTFFWRNGQTFDLAHGGLQAPHGIRLGKSEMLIDTR